MESNSEASCISDPNFAVICAFLERFAKSCGITHPPFLDLQEMLENIDEVPQQLIDLHIILLRKAKRSVFREKWEKALVKFCQIYSTQDGWEIERFGYKNSRLEVKLRVLKNLLEGQFDLNCKFKSIINTHESSDLRSKPVGKDKSGRIYWLQIDPTSNIRVYREDLDEESWTLVAKDRDTLIQLLQELTVDEEPVDVNLLNEDSSVSVDIEKTILDTGQESFMSDVVTNGDALIEEKDPLEIKTGETSLINDDVGYDDCYNDVLNDVGKRASEDLFMEGDFKKPKLDNGENDVELGEAIDDPVMHIYGEGNGAECDAGNPDKEEHKSDEGNSSDRSDQSEPVQSTSTDIKKIDLETKPQPKLWSIDTICGTGSFNHSGESSKSVKSVQKNFSSFSIESVLEKKSDTNHSSSPVPESPIISVNALTPTDPVLGGSINQSNEQIISTSDVIAERSVSQSCNESAEDVPILEEGKTGETEESGKDEKSENCENETDSVPNVQNRTENEDSTICAGNSTEEKETNAAEEILDTNLELNSENTILTNQEVPESTTESLDCFKEDILKENDSVEVPTKSEETLKIESDTLEAKESIDVKDTTSEHMSDVNNEDVEGGSSVAGVGNDEKPLEEIEETKSKISEIEDSVEEALPDEKEDKEDKGSPEGQEEGIREEQLAGERVDTVTEKPEKESEKVGLEEKVEPLQETNECSKEVFVAEEDGQSKSEPKIEGDLTGSKEVSEDLNEQIEEEKPFEAIQKVDENSEMTLDEVVLNKEFNVPEIESAEAEQEKIPDLIPEEKSEVEVPAEDASKTENESLIRDEMDEAAIPESAPSKVEDIQNPIPELSETWKNDNEKDEKMDIDDISDTTEISAPVERIMDEYNLQKQISSEVKTESALTENMDAHETDDVESGAPDLPRQDFTEPSKESGEIPLAEVTEKEETPMPEETYPNDTPTEVAPKEEENCEESSHIISEEIKEEKELPPSDEVKEEPVEDKTDKNDDNEDPKEEDESKMQPGKGRKRRRSRKQSGEIVPARATRSAKRSTDEDFNIFLELPMKKETRKRKSQDSDNADVGKVSESGEGDEASTVQDLGEENKVEATLDSTANAATDETPAVPQEKVVATGGKRKKKRSKRRREARKRKSTEEKPGSSGDEKKVAEEGEAMNDEEKKKKTPKNKPKDGTPRTRQLIPERELKLLGITNMEELPTVRQSRRIAQLKLREEAERKKLEEAAKEEAKKEKKRKKKKKKLSKTSAKKRKTGTATGEESYDEEDGGGDDDEDDEVKPKDKKRKKKKRDKLVFNELNPWISSSGSSSADEDEEDIEDEAHEEEEILFKSDHEFSPESDMEDPDYKPIKRARTAKVDPKDATEADSKYDDTACEKCGEKDHPEWILLCDKCDKGWHASCVRPALMVVPEGDWFCPPCEHTSLVQKLRESLIEYDRCQKQRENEELRRKRLAFVGISLDNVLPSKKEKKPKPFEENEGESEETASENGGEDSSSSGSSSSDSSSSGESSEPVYQLRERRTNVTSYRYNEYDELIKSALQEEMEAAKGVGLGKGKDIGNQAEGYEGVEEGVDGSAAAEGMGLANVSGEAENNTLNPQIPKDIIEAKPRLKSKKDGDEDYEVESDAEEDEEFNEEENGEAEDEELGDELPPVVPRYDKKKKKARSLNVRGLDFTSDEEEEDNSDSDFKGESSEEESEYSLPSESESSDGIRKKQKSFDGPLRRSTRARTARYDKEFINDDSEDEAPRKKKSRNIWVESESSDSDRSWGKRKKRNTRGGNRSTMPKKKTKAKAKKKKSRRKSGDSDYEDEGKSKKSRNRKVKYGGLDDLDEEQVLVRRTRGKKINYQEMNASDSEDEVLKRRPRVIGDSDEEFVAEKEKSEDSDAEDEGGVTKKETNGKAVSKKSIFRKLKKKRPKVIPDPDDFSEEDLLEDEVLDAFAEELEDLDEEEEDLLQEMLNDGDVPIRELREALGKLKERRKEKTNDVKPYPPIPEHMENPGVSPRFPKISKMKMAPNRSELSPQLGLPTESTIPGVRPNPGLLLGNLPKDGDRLESVRKESMMLLNEPKTDSKEGLMNLQPPPYPFTTEGPGVPTLLNAPAFPLNNRPPAPPYSSFQGIIPPHTRLPPEYPHPNIPTTVLGIENDSIQDIRKQGQKPASNNKRKNEDGLSPQADSGEENSGDGRIGDNVDSPKRRGRGRGKKQLLAEAQAKQEIPITTVQAPTQFPPRGPGPEGPVTGSVITRMLNAPQGPQPFPPDFTRGRSFRPPFANALRPPLNPPSPSPLRTPSTLAAPPSLPLFHVTLPLDISPTSIGLPQGKPSQLPPGFPSRPTVLPRYTSDPSIRPPFPSHSSSPRENFPYPNFYPGPFPPPIPNNEEAAFHNPNFPTHPFDEHSIPVGALKPPYEEEVGGEFGGLASYFASQREDDLDT